MWWDILTLIALLVVIMGLFSMAMYTVGGELGMDKDTISAFSYIGSFLLSISAFYIYRNVRNGKPAAVRTIARHRTSPQMLLWSFLTIVWLGIALEPLVSMLPDKHFANIDALVQNSYGALLSIIVAPILEEWFFRGQLQRSLTNKYGAMVGVTVASVTFGLIHGNPIQILTAIPCGIVLGFVYNHTNSLGAAIFVHALNNAFSFAAISILGSSGITLCDMLEEYRTIYWIIYTSSVLLGAGSLLIMILKLRKKQ
ncbi:MAG: CPBP family intramembrane metalloprotease [Rikenellaceae bacterium]|nr:CPBP family intramembrane metalloprotease [Rikenellaceae bacterium]